MRESFMRLIVSQVKSLNEDMGAMIDLFCSISMLDKNLFTENIIFSYMSILFGELSKLIMVSLNSDNKWSVLCFSPVNDLMMDINWLDIA